MKKHESKSSGPAVFCNMKIFLKPQIVVIFWQATCGIQPRFKMRLVSALRFFFYLVGYLW
jgi:hypothetical protein